MKKIALILSGAGVFDGSEIHESVLTMLAVCEFGGEYSCFAPDIEQAHVIDHVAGTPQQDQTRNVLQESARIARGEIAALTELDAQRYDGLILPGGFGAAKNLCNFAFEGQNMTVDTSVLSACQQFAKLRKPAGYACIAPVIMPKVYAKGVKMTIGNDIDTAAAVEAMGANHINCAVDDVVIDEKHRVVSTPAYMLAANILEARASIFKLVKAVMDMID